MDCCQSIISPVSPVLEKEAKAAVIPKRLFLCSSSSPLQVSYGYKAAVTTVFSQKIYEELNNLPESNKTLANALQDALQDYHAVTVNCIPSILNSTWPYNFTL